MPSTVEYHLNKTLGIEYEVPCVRCAGRTTHRVLASMDVQGEDGDGGFSVSWIKNHQVVQCLGCKSVSFREASSNSEDYFEIDGGTSIEYSVLERLYPPRIEGLKGLGDETRFLPTNVQRIYDETLLALSNLAPVLTGIGLRALLETVCKEKKATGRKLLEKIDSLVTIGVLTPNGAAILHKIRALGNAAAHEVKPHSERQLSLAMDIVEHLLKDVYILPKQVESEFESEN